jgi:acetyl esterase/lipase
LGFFCHQISARTKARKTGFMGIVSGYDFLKSRQPFLGLWLCFMCILSGCAGLGTATERHNILSSAKAIEADSVIPLWPGLPPGAPPALPQEHIVYRTNPFGLVDRAAHDVAVPTLSIFAPEQSNGGAILIIPGGGFSWVVVDKEGYEGARYFTKLGYHVYVLRYRLPHQGWAAGPDTPLQDAQRAMRVIRSRAAQDRINPQTLMVMGFSAGGHVAGSLALKSDQQLAPALDDIDRLPARPDLAVLMYPVVTMTEPFAHPKSRENMIGRNPSPSSVANHSLEVNPNPQAPPMFILHAGDDAAVPIENAQMLYAALHKAKIPVAFHVFEKGGHGFGLRGIEGTPLQRWPNLVLDWAQTHGFAKPN